MMNTFSTIYWYRHTVARIMASHYFRFDSATILACLSLLLFCTFHATGAQQEPDSRGKEFRIAFLPNIHATNTSLDSLFIFITSQKPTQGKIEYTDINGETKSAFFQITDTNTVFRFQIWHEDYELIGFVRDQIDDLNSLDEVVSYASFHITATEDVTVYGLNQAVTSSDAFLALPLDALGLDYRVMSYYSDGKLEGSTIGDQSTPSEFAVVATQDQTTITITPSVPTRRYGLSSQTVVLSAGEAYLVQADITEDHVNYDLTGTFVHADKPVAVFSGHQRAVLPINSKLRSRDQLVEQLLPVDTWGRSAFLTSYPLPPDASTRGSDLYRVLAAFDSTSVYLNGSLLTILNAGQFYEAPLPVGFSGSLTADAPIQVAQYKKSSIEEENTINDRESDPFMMLIPPAEQYLNFYRFVNVQVREKDQPVYTDQYITLVIPTSEIPSIRLDKAPLPDTVVFTPIPMSSYSYTNFLMSDGTHTVEADTGIGLYVYGYGAANSYGYIGGLQLKHIVHDLTPPMIAGQPACLAFTGMIFDSAATDSRIKRIEVPPDSIVNAAVTIGSLAKRADAVSFTAHLVNPYEDGSFTLVASDSMRLKATRTIGIPGFTVHLDSSFRHQEVVSQTRQMPTTAYRCFTYQLVNYGTYPQTITDINFRQRQTGWTIDAPLPLVLPPGGTSLIQICVDAKTEGIFTDTLSLQSTCASRSILALTIQTAKDVSPPHPMLTSDPCNTQIELAFTEEFPLEWGIAQANILEARNCTIVSNASGLPASFRFGVSITDPRQDAIYAVVVADSSGNTRMVRDTVQGFTLSVLSPPAPENILSYGSLDVGDIQCDSITVKNYGVLPFAINHTDLAQNIFFSAPEAQFPVVIAPGDSAHLAVCFRPLDQKDMMDTLFLRKNCLTEEIFLHGAGTTIAATGTSGCGAEIHLVGKSKPGTSFLEPNFPNPVNESTTLRAGLMQTGMIEIFLYTALGQPISTIKQPIPAAGLYDITLDTSHLENGVYFYEFHAPDIRVLRSFIIVH